MDKLMLIGGWESTKHNAEPSGISKYNHSNIDAMDYNEWKRVTVKRNTYGKHVQTNYKLRLSILHKKFNPGGNGQV